ncbi:hypothetical protein BJI68_28885 [Escherichia coli]|nr:hypothetical protein BJI68_28885 [Escherichia coli]
MEAKEREGVKKSLIAEYEMQKETAEKKVEALNAEKLAQSVQDTKLVEQEEIAKRDKLKTDALNAEFEQLQNNIAVLKLSRDELKADIESRQAGLESLKDEWRKYTDTTARIVNLLEHELQSENFTPEGFLKKAKEISEVSIASQLYQRSRTP